jgi:HK97 family phage prohead protease
MYKTQDFRGVNQIKGIDMAKMTVEGYLSAFDVIDSDTDMLMRGAFNKSIQERGPQSKGNRKIAFLRGHNTDKPVGKFLELYEDQIGLKYVAQMSESTLGKDTLVLMQEGILNEHSIGYMRISDKEKYNGQYNEVKEVMLFEGSVLTFGANADTPVINVKSSPELRQKEIVSLAARMDKITKLIRKGSGLTDEMFSLLEIELLQIKSSYESLVNEPRSTPKNEPMIDISRISLI